MSLTRDEWIFLIILIVNAIVAIVYYLWNILVTVSAKSAKRKKKNRELKEQGKDPEEQMNDNRRTYLIRFLIMLLCPVVGPLFFLLAHLLHLALFWSQVDLDDVVFSKERVRIQLKADEERERNVVPLEEAISVNEKKNLRLAMMNMLKGDIQNSLSSIALALNSEDSESSHYASSVLSDRLNEFRMQAQKMYQEIQQPETPEAGEEKAQLLVGYMDPVLKQRVFSPMEQNRLVHMMADAAGYLYEKDASKLAAPQYESVALRLLEIKDYETSETWCLRLAEQYPQQLPAYTCRLKLYFTTKRREAFFETLHALKQSDVVIDHETLELIRLFS